MDERGHQSPPLTTSLTASPSSSAQSSRSPGRFSPRRLSSAWRNFEGIKQSPKPPISPKRRDSKTSPSTPSNKSVLRGVTRHYLGGSSSYHRSSYATELERVKARLRKLSTSGSHLNHQISGDSVGDNGYNSLDISTRSEFLPRAPPSRPRPADLSTRSDSYAVNVSACGSRTPAGTRRKTIAIGSSAFDSSADFHEVPRGATRSNSPGKLRDKTRFPRPIPPLAPPVAEMNKLQGTPIGEKEKVDRSKFVAAFSAFEGDNDFFLSDNLCDTRGSSHSSRAGASRMPSISPKTGAKRNFVVSKEARAKSLKLSMKPLNDSAHTATSEHKDELRAIISNLRKVVVPRKDATKSEQQASEIMEMIKVLRKTALKTAGAEELKSMVSDLRKKGIILSNLDQKRMKELEKAIESLQIIKNNILDPKKVCEDMELSLEQLKRLTPTCADSTDMIHNETGRLKSVRSELPDPENGQMKSIIARLETILNDMYDADEQQLARAIRKLDEDHQSARGMLELARVLNTMESTGDLNEEQEICKRLSSETVSKATDRIPPQDVDNLIRVLLKLKGVKMTLEEAAKVATFIRKTKGAPVPSQNDDMYEIEVSRITSDFNSVDKVSKVTEALLDMRPLKLNSHERSDIANLVRDMGKLGGKYADSIQDAIAKLSKNKMNPDQAKEVSRIMFKLRKVKGPSRRHYDIDNSKEMINLRKIMKSKSADVVAEVFKTVQDLDVNEKDIYELAKSVADLGVEPLEPNDHQVVHVDLYNGQPYIVLNIPGGEEYLKQLEKIHNSDCISYKQVFGSREFRLVVDLDDSSDSDVLACDGDSELEDEDDVEIEDNNEDRNTVFEEASCDPVGTRDNRDFLEKGRKFEVASDVEFVSDSESSQLFGASTDTNELPGEKGETASFISDSQDMHSEINSKSETYSNMHEEVKHNEKDSTTSPPDPPMETPPTANRKKNQAALNIKLNYYGSKQDEAELVLKGEEEREKKIRVLNKHHWRHNKHHGTVVQEKRWRVDEDFDVDEVIWSPLTHEQYDRRKTVGSAILKSIDRVAPLDDIVWDEFEEGKEMKERKSDAIKSQESKKLKGKNHRHSIPY